MANYYPLFLDIRDQTCIVVGGGSVAERKVLSLLECGASVNVISPEITEALAGLKREERISHIAREYRPGDLDRAVIVVAATNDESTNETVYQHALAARLLVNVVDQPERCNFIVPSVVRRGNLTIAISTSGRSPALAKRIRQDIEAMYPEEYALYVEKLASVRDTLRKELESPEDRETVWRRLMAANLMEIVRTGNDEAVSQKVRSEIELSRKESGAEKA